MGPCAAQARAVRACTRTAPDYSAGLRKPSRTRAARLAPVADGCDQCEIRRGGRVVEGARLESVYTGNRIAGSNPAPSANFPGP